MEVSMAWQYLDSSERGSGELAEPDPAARSFGNSDNIERLACGLSGLAMAAWGLRRRDSVGLAGAGLGALFLLHGLTGRPPVAAAVRPTPFEKSVARSRGWRSAAATVQAITIAVPRAEVYRFWRNFENLPRFMHHLERVDVLDDRRSHWVVKAPLGRRVEWDAVVTEERTDELIAWESVTGAEIRNTGRVEFRDAPHERGTELRVVVAYEPPAGRLGRAAAKLLGREPALQIRQDLRRLKQTLETGEIVTAACRRNLAA
jgi:uncharacterized membrane protein